MTKPKIGIIGYGVVGQAVEYGFEGCDIVYYDKYKPSSTLEEVCKQSEFIFIALPTPFKQTPVDGLRIDLQIINDAMREIVPITNGTDKIVVIKSTVVPETTRNLSKKYPETNFAFNPEFLTEANFLEDFKNADRHVVGADNNKVRLRVTALYEQFWPKTDIYQTDTTTAEVVKYAANCLLATKVIFANEFHDLCRNLGVEWSEAKKMIVADHRIGPTHLDVHSLRGFGQKCFPKDIIAILGLFEDLNVDSKLLSAVWEKNKEIRKVWDWEDIPFVKTKS